MPSAEPTSSSTAGAARGRLEPGAAGRRGAVPASSSRKRDSAGAVGEHGDSVAATRDGHVQHAALLLDVLGEAVGDDAVGDAEHGDAVPLPALHPVDRRQRHAGWVGFALERRAQPRLEPGRVGVQVGDAEQALEVVEVARALTAAGAVEQAHRRAQADVVAHRLEHVAGRAVAPGVDDDDGGRRRGAAP